MRVTRHGGHDNWNAGGGMALGTVSREGISLFFSSPGRRQLVARQRPPFIRREVDDIRGSRPLPIDKEVLESGHQPAAGLGEQNRDSERTGEEARNQKKNPAEA